MRVAWYMFYGLVAVSLAIVIGYYYITDYSVYQQQVALCKKACSIWGDNSVKYAYVNKEGDYYMCYCKYERWIFTQNQTWSVTHSFKFGTIYNVSLIQQINNTLFNLTS